MEFSMPLIMDIMLSNMDCMLPMSDEMSPVETGADDEEEELELMLLADDDTEDDVLEEDEVFGADEGVAGFLGAGGGTTVFTCSTTGTLGIQTPGVMPVSRDEQRSVAAQSLGE